MLILSVHYSVSSSLASLLLFTSPSIYLSSINPSFLFTFDGKSVAAFHCVRHSEVLTPWMSVSDQGLGSGSVFLGDAIRALIMVHKARLVLIVDDLPAYSALPPSSSSLPLTFLASPSHSSLPSSLQLHSSLLPSPPTSTLITHSDVQRNAGYSFLLSLFLFSF